ncbi:radical SAM protein [Bailinhaonella thermotolerans]|uniref:Radical SAM protein n=1 Tax=Bailinhaonella thermotolerans TaxID=1070861 RepID=A0A3A4BNN8_9ACTN|nr:radical SAM protein [Bailinhaonella thermotolerans]RJL32664.1 radical SAM protein [Bailinhaonella thermotolerans]
MRWDALALVEVRDDRPRIERQAVVREAGDTTFYEVRARTAIERVPSGSGLPHAFAVNPYRGCAHACRHCGARGGHRRLGLDSGRDFETRIAVRTDVAARLRAELARRPGISLAVGVTGDCYQPAEERYLLMPGVIAALRDAAVPFTVHTKNPLVLRDAELLAECPLGSVSVSVAFVDDRVRRAVEPGAPAPQRRLELLAELAERGVAVHALMAPVLPLLTDSGDQLAATVGRLAAAGVRSVSPIVLRLPPGAREAYLSWLEEAHPRLLPRYADLYDRAGRPSPAYEQRVRGEVAGLARLYGMSLDRPAPPPAPPAFPQLALI